MEVASGGPSVRNPTYRRVVDFGRRIPRPVNPLYGLVWICHVRGRGRSQRNLEKALAMSLVADAMDREHKRLITVRRDGAAVTPQQSFVNFFGSRDLESVKVSKFIHDFVTLFSDRGESWLRELGSPATPEEVDGFWGRFAHLLESSSAAVRPPCRSLRMRARIWAVGRFMGMRRWMRVLLSGTGR